MFAIPLEQSAWLFTVILALVLIAVLRGDLRASVAERAEGEIVERVYNRKPCCCKIAFLHSNRRCRNAGNWLINGKYFCWKHAQKQEPTNFQQ